MFGAELGDIQAGMGHVYNFLAHTPDLVSENKGVFQISLHLEPVQRDAVYCLFHSYYGMVLGF